ncbi:hypothetical protein WIW50_10000 [Flavobacteriaceae bacterium 3-367]
MPRTLQMKTSLLYPCFFFCASLLCAQDGIRELGILPNEVEETSGLVFYNGRILTHNDSGNDPQLFEIDTLSLEVLRTVRISNAENVDWEDMAQDEAYFYIGDFGNFNGDRRDLAVYRVAKADYDSSDTVSADRIDFTYADQTDFSPTPRSNWDAEALVVLGSELVILTKQWQDLGSVAYALPKVPGSHIARNLGSYPVNGLLTGATYNPTTQVLFLIGYSELLLPFTLRFSEVTIDSFFVGDGERINLNIGFAQIEGITFSTEAQYFVSSERFVNDNPPITAASRLFSFSIAIDAEPVDETPEEGNQLLLYRRLGSGDLGYELQTERRIFGRAIFDALGRRITYTRADRISGNTVDISGLRAAIYYLTFYLDDEILSKPFVLD